MIPTTWKHLKNGNSALTVHHDDSFKINKGNIVWTLAEDLGKMTWNTKPCLCSFNSYIFMILSSWTSYIHLKSQLNKLHINDTFPSPSQCRQQMLFSRFLFPRFCMHSSNCQSQLLNNCLNFNTECHSPVHSI